MPRTLPWMLLLGGAVGFLAAFLLTVEKIALIADSAYEPSCSINPVLSCGSVMATPQAQAFGFPNSLIGIAGFAVVAATGAALLAGARLRGWYWTGLQAGVVFGAGLVHWLIFQSLYRIGALCPYCMVVWAVTMPLFWYVTLRNLAAVGDRLPPPVRRVVAALVGLHGVLLTGWYLLVMALILHRFWYFWSGSVLT
ncbi:vitamin K epoxide reductase family protein [Pseudonocardia sp. KRD291]|uniref:vitamin K epoxide reductase family protein n=1 Tax=Pseudonocardia sp. KRD291 TaxID=2792007 RepID=UPI001C4A60A3|nr:vitamin K epoxide reductase family protein [Pseudonocardia sp. KRD291]MBW0103732.1 vitamin K epoxide reductase family protein [Pseudonocardia sp. KRD291]